jgi:hypothetical protein
MSDVSVSLGVTGKDVVTGAFKEVGQAGKEMGEALMEHTKKLAEMFLGYEALVKVVETFKQTFELGAQLQNFSERTGIAVDKLVVLQRAFENNGMKAEDLGSIVNKMQKTIESAGVEGSAAADKIGRLGLKVSDLAAMTPDQQFEAIAKAIAKVQDPTEKAADAMQIFGKAGGQTLALFNNFDEAITGAKAEVGSFADEMGNNAKGFKEIGDGLTEIGNKAVEFSTGLLTDSIPAMETLVEYFKTVDATAFGKGFSSALATGLDVALSVFTNPGNLFLAFGDALVLAFKVGINTFDSGLVYVFEWAKNYLSAIIPNYAGLLQAEFTAAFGFVASGFSKMLAEIFTGIAGYLPEKFGGPLAAIGNQLAKTSDEWSNKASAGLATAWDGIAGAAEKATEQTHFQLQDYMDAEGTAASLKDHIEIAAEGGAAVRDHIAEGLENAKLITAEANAWDKATSSMADNFAGVTGSFKDFAAGNTESSGLASLSGLKISSEGVGPVASASDRVSGANSSRSSRESYQSGRTNDPLKSAMESLLQNSDYVSATTGDRSSFDQIQQRMETRAAQQTSSDLSYYTGGDSRASKQGAIDDLFRKYQEDVGGNPADLRKKAEEDFQKIVNDKLGGTGGTDDGSGSGGLGKGGKAEAPKSPESGILAEIKALITTICNERLPIQVLA